MTVSFCGIAVMAKASHPGRTKTRLSPPLTLEEAARFNTAFLKDIADNLLRASETAGISGYMAYGPSGADHFFKQNLPEEIGLMEVWIPGFDACLMRALELQFAAGHGAACVLNSDSPTLPSKILCETAEALAKPGDRIVFGPSTDGGYYLLGCKQVHTRLFEDITWSTEVVAEQTLARAAEIGLEVYMLPEWYDVDDGASLRILAGELLEGRPFSEGWRSSAAHHSATLLRDMMQHADLFSRLRPNDARLREEAAA